jgi:zona occludens toxin
MGVYAVCGVPGSGKTLYLLKKFFVPALKAKRNIYTNIEGLNIYRMAEIFGFDAMECASLVHLLTDENDPENDKERIRYFYREYPDENLRPDNSIFIIDEAQNYFGSRDFKEQYSNDLIKYITRHRHYGHDVVWATQVIESVDISFRRNTAITYALRRMEHLGAKNSSFVYVFDRTDLERRHLTRNVFSFDKKYFACYDSYVAEDVSEKRKSYNVILRSPFVWLGTGAIIWALYTVLSGSFSEAVFKTPPKREKPKTEIVQQKTETQKTITEDSSNVANEDYSELCYTKKIRVGGLTRLTLLDGSVSTDLSLRPCSGAK